MEKKQNSQPVREDERTTKITNKYFAHGFLILATYIFLGIVFKPFLFDIHPMHYWDAGIILLAVFIYIMIRTSREGVTLEPNFKFEGNWFKKSVKSYGIASLAFGFFFTFYISGLEENMAALFPGLTGKIVGAIVVALIMYILMVGILYLTDYKLVKYSEKKAEEIIED